METGAGEANPRLRVLATVSEEEVRFPASMSGGSKVPVTPPLREQKVSGLRGQLLLCTNLYIKTHK